MAELAVRQRAEELGHGLEWKQPDDEDLTQEDDKWMDRYPKNYWVLNRKAKKLLAQKKWQEAKAPIQTLLDHFRIRTRLRQKLKAAEILFEIPHLLPARGACPDVAFHPLL